MKKLVSILLVVVMLTSSLCIATSAEGEYAVTYHGVATHNLTVNGSVSETLFNVDVTIDESKFTCFDGGTTAWDKAITSVVASYQVTTFDGTIGEVLTADYIVDPEAFFAIFAKQDEDRAAIDEYNSNLVEGQTEHAPVNAVSFTVEFDIMFVDPDVFGSLDYTVTLNVMEPMQMDIPLVGGLLDAALLPTEVDITGKIWNFPKIDPASVIVLKRPAKTDYYDNEIFDLEGTQIQLSTRRALTDDANSAYVPVASGTVTYKANNDNKDANAYMFTCHPQRGTKLTVNTTSVVTFFNGMEIGKTPVVVQHKWSDGPVGITTDKWTESKPGYHATVCEGCGETHNAENHKVDDSAWVLNNDQTFLTSGTMSNTCLECGATITADIVGTEDYNNVFANYHFLKVIFDYISIIFRIIGAAGIN